MPTDVVLWKYSFLFVLIRLMDFNENETLQVFVFGYSAYTFYEMK